MKGRLKMPKKFDRQVNVPREEAGMGAASAGSGLVVPLSCWTVRVGMGVSDGSTLCTRRVHILEEGNCVRTAYTIELDALAFAYGG